ncbi:hypothetical protein Tco_0990315, partial [Tanacetum coccineum]
CYHLALCTDTLEITEVKGNSMLWQRTLYKLSRDHVAALTGSFCLAKGSNEAVYKELDDNLVRAATTAFSLKVEQDSGNITKTRSKETLNEPSSSGTSSGSGLRRQETMGDTIAQTRFENVSKLSNDPLLVRGNTLRSGEDSLKLNELMELCTNLQQRVLDLETTKINQANEIASLKRRVKKLENKDRSRTHKLKSLYKVGLSARIESSADEEDLGEDASKQGRMIHDIDADEDISLVNDDNEIFDVDALAALAEFKSAKPKADKVVIQEPKQGTTTTTPTTITPVPKPPQDKGKWIMIEEPIVEQVKPMKRLEQMRLDEELAFKLKDEEEEEEEERLAREKAQQSKEKKYFAAKRAEEKRNRPPTRAQQMNIMTELVEESSKKAKTELEDNLKKAEAEVMEDEEEVAIDVVPLATKPPSIVDWKIYKEGKKTYYQIIRADGSSKMYLVFSHMLKSFDREDLETLWKLVKAKHGSTRPEEGYERVLWGDLKGRIVGIKRLLDDLRVTAAQVYVTAAKLNLPPEWSKFVTDVKLVKDLHTTNFDQLHAYIEQHELHANEVRLLCERNQDPLAFVANQQMTPPHFNTYQSSYNNPHIQQQFSPS